MSDPAEPTFQIDTTVAHPARIYDYWLGGNSHFKADRVAGEAVLAHRPGLRESVRANRRFLVRVVRWLTSEAGIRQFLDIGTGIPLGDGNNTHDVAQQIAPECRVVYVDYDPIVLAHAHELRTSTPQGTAVYIDGDLRRTQALLDEAAKTLDFTQPVAILLLGVLHLISDDEDPYAIVNTLTRSAASGSYLVISHPASDLLPDTQPEASRQYNQRVSTSQRLRSRGQVQQFFDGLELVEPGLVQWHQWRPDGADDTPSDAITGHSGVARIP